MKCVAFVLFHTGETRALLPTIHFMANHPEQYRVVVIPVGQAARRNLPLSLERLIQVPHFLLAGLGQNDAAQTMFDATHVQDVIARCHDSQYIVMGSPATIQEQIAQALPASKQRIVYFDMGCNERKINAFLPFADLFVMTTLAAEKMALALVQQSHVEKKPMVLAGRHGDFDHWRDQYLLRVQKRESIPLGLCVAPADKIILWAGGYGDFSQHDQEAVAFKTFIESFQSFKRHYKLRITVHPGLNSYEPEKLQAILHRYYVHPLLELGFSEDESHQAVTSLDTFSVACVAHAVVSLNSTAGPQAVFIGSRAKNVFLNDTISPLVGIKTVKTPDEWQMTFHRWLSKGRREPDSTSYQKAMNKLSIPDRSTQFILENYMMTSTLSLASARPSLFYPGSEDEPQSETHSEKGLRVHNKS